MDNVKRTWLKCRQWIWFNSHDCLMLSNHNRQQAWTSGDLLTEQVITHTFLGFCLSQLYIFLHTANRLWRLGACLEGQLHSETYRGMRHRSTVTDRKTCERNRKEWNITEYERYTKRRKSWIIMDKIYPKEYLCRLWNSSMSNNNNKTRSYNTKGFE